MEIQANSLPDVVGAAFPQENLNGDLTRGIDLEVNHRNTLGKFNYSVKGIMSIARTKNTTFIQAPFGNSYLNWDGNAGGLLERTDGITFIGDMEQTDSLKIIML